MHEILEFLDDDEIRDLPLFRHDTRQTHHHIDIIVIKVPIDRNDFVAGSETRRIKHEVCTSQKLRDDSRILLLRRIKRPYHSSSELYEKLLQCPDIEQVDMHDHKLFAGSSHIVQSLLYDRHLS